jgi:hypothetical protein
MVSIHAFFRETGSGVFIHAIAPYRRDPEYWKQRTQLAAE